MNSIIRLYFSTCCAVAVIVFVGMVLMARAGSQVAGNRPEGLGRHLLGILTAVLLIVPPFVILTGVGEINADWPVVRLSGVLLSLYAGGMEFWAARTLGRFYVPWAVVLEDHTLITSGPYRFLRHPDYSSLLALWLGYTLGTLNVWLLLLFPIMVIGFSMEASLEDRLLASKFGDFYRRYAAGKRRFIPRLRFDAPTAWLEGV